MNQSKFEIYQLENGETEINVQLKNDTVWLSLSQLVTLFKRDKSVISRHINNIFKEGELNKESVVAKNATTASDGKEYQVEYYNLDLIISVGYRVKSKQGIKFRIWANQVLKSYIVKGYVLNQEKLLRQGEQLKELQKSIKILGEVLEYKLLSNDESQGLLKLISDYSYALELLDKYDYQTIEITNISEEERYILSYDEAIKQISMAKKAFGNSQLFGREKDKSFRSSIATIYQTFNGVELYPSIEEKAANLLYFIVKNHSFTDGNKRIAALLFLYFLDKNSILFYESGEKRIADNTLVALTLMIAVSKQEEKDVMTKVVVNLINRNN